MVFHFKLEKTMQAVAALLRFHNTKEMSYLRMLKLLYVADRQSLQETGLPITGDQIVAMAHGPVLSGLYDLVKGTTTAWPQWSEYFRKNGYRIEIVKDPGNGKLSKYEINKLQDITNQFENMCDWELVEYVHTFDEWKRNNSGKSSKRIPLDHVIEAIGRLADKDAIIQDAKDQNEFDRLFSSLKG